MRLAHFVLAHNHPGQLERLAWRLSHADADVYIHLDLKTDIAPFQQIRDTVPNVFFISNRVSVVWCEYSTIQATINGLEEIMASGKAYTHINLLSGNDYPLQKNDVIHNFLFANTSSTFMHHELIFNDWSHGQARMNNYHLGDYNIPGMHHSSAVLNKLLPHRRLPGGLAAYGRSQWLTITPVCVEYVLRYIKDNPKLRRFFRMTWAVDEVFFQTILCNSPLKHNLVNDNLRYIVLNDEYRPVTYTMDDAEALITSGKFYARKFDMNKNSAILDHLDQAAL